MPSSLSSENVSDAQNFHPVLSVHVTLAGDISRVPPQIAQIFPEEALNPFFGAHHKEFFEISFYITAFVFLMLNKFMYSKRQEERGNPKT